MTTPLHHQTCEHCGARVMAAVDHATSERILLDRQPVDGGHVELRRLPGLRLRVVAVDHLTRPAPHQPGYELHTRTCTHPPAPEPVDLSDDGAREKSGGWRR